MSKAAEHSGYGLLATRQSERPRVVLDPKGHTGILSHIDRGIRELMNRAEALADFRDQGKVRGLRAGLPELLSETVGSIFLKA